MPNKQKTTKPAPLPVLTALSAAEAHDVNQLFDTADRPQRQKSLTRLLIHLVEGDNFDLIRDDLQPLTGELGMLLNWQ